MSSHSHATPGNRASSRGPPPTGFRCNRCCKPLTTTVFVCACDCVFCEECTYEHFNNNSVCPNCSRALNPNDFMELVVADPNAASQDALKNSFQTIFTKHSPNSELCQQDMCHRLLKSLENDKRAVRFMMKQFMVQSKHAGKKSGDTSRAFNALQKEYVQLKQSSNSQKLQADKTIADLQQHLKMLQSAKDEKDNQLRKFREMSARDGMARIPSSSHSTGSNSRGGGSNNSNEGRRQQQSRPSNPPPLQAYILQKQAREREKEHALGQVTRRKIHGPGVGSVVSPIQAPPHYVRPSVDSVPLPEKPRNSSQRNRLSNPPPSPQQRSSSNFSRGQSSSSGYNFSTSRRR